MGLFGFASREQNQDSFSSGIGSVDTKIYERNEVMKDIQTLDKATILAWRAEREGQKQGRNVDGWNELTACIDSGKAFYDEPMDGSGVSGGVPPELAAAAGSGALPVGPR